MGEAITAFRTFTEVSSSELLEGPIILQMREGCERVDVIVESLEEWNHLRGVPLGCCLQALSDIILKFSPIKCLSYTSFAVGFTLLHRHLAVVAHSVHAMLWKTVSISFPFLFAGKKVELVGTRFLERAMFLRMEVETNHDSRIFLRGYFDEFSEILRQGILFLLTGLTEASGHEVVLHINHKEEGIFVELYLLGGNGFHLFAQE
mmetsp:Transcript_81850/g.171203  ORF Transcript_81850/g.171203 Transcript_81850/m.171203 type:complete len:205 (-) Transcript_81850:192-806(-)